MLFEEVELEKWSELCFYEVFGKNDVSVEVGEDRDPFPFECEFGISINQIRYDFAT